MGRLLVAVVVLMIITAAFAVGTWKLGWFVEEKNIDQRTRIDNRSRSAQQAWHDEAVRTIADFRVLPASETGARGALRDQACSLIARLVPDYRDAPIVAFESACA